jgi:hypothetical protein
MRKELLNEFTGALFAGLVVLICTGSYLLYQSFFYKAPSPAVVPPEENTDGTIDYALINKFLYDEEPTFWVLRFPKDQLVETSEDWTGNYKGSGVSVGLRTRPNQYLSIYFEDEKLKDYLIKSEFGRAGRLGQITVTVRATENLAASKDGSSFESVRDINKHCKLLERVVPGVLLYGNDVGVNNGSLEQRGCAGVGFDPPGYTEAYVVVQNDEGNPVGELSCGVAQNDRASRICNGRFIVGIAREVSVTFGYALLPRVRELRDSIDKYLSSRTIKVETSATIRKRLSSTN